MARGMVARLPGTPAEAEGTRLDHRVALSVAHLTGSDALHRLGERYDALTTAAGCPLTARRPWLQTWVDCYAPAWQAWVPVVEGGDRLRAAAPLATRRRAGVLQVRGVGFGRTDDVRLPALDDDAARLLAHAVRARLAEGGPWLLELEQLPVGDRVVAGLAEALPQAEVVAGDGSPTVRIGEREPNRYLSKNTRKALAKIRNRLADAGLEPVVRWTSEAAEVAALLPELAAVHRARDEALGRRGDHSDPRAARFYEQVVLRHAELGEVEVLTLRLEGDLAAYVLAFRDGKALRSWDNRLAPRWSDYSAGRLANTEAILRVVADPELDELDWMRGEEPYKLQSATDVVPTVTLRAWSSRVVRTADRAVGRAREAKRSSPALHTAWVRTARVRDAVRARASS